MGRRRRTRRVDLKPAGEEEKEKEKEQEIVRFIPEDVVLIILSYLPVRSLLRFRFVSKQWLYLISSITTQTQKVIFPLKNENFLFQSIEEYTKVEEIEIVLEKKIARQLQAGDYPFIYGSCNGFLLVRLGIYLFLWNPSIRRSVGMLHNKMLRDYYGNEVTAGLCCNTNKDEYKVVLVLHAGTDVFVGSFKTKSWSQVDRGHPRFLFISSGPVVNSYLHMWCYLEVDLIVYFDPKTDKFEKLPMPELEQEEECELCDGIGVLDRCVCVTREHMSVSDGYCVNVWVMRQHGVQESWVVLFKFEWDEYAYHVQPLQFTDENKSRVMMMVQMYHSSSIVAYDINSKSSKEVADVNGECKPIVYEETVYKSSINCLIERDTPASSKQVWRLITKKRRTLQNGVQGKDSVNVLEEIPEEEESALRRIMRRPNRFSLLEYVSDEDYPL